MSSWRETALRRRETTSCEPRFCFVWPRFLRPTGRPQREGRRSRRRRRVGACGASCRPEPLSAEEERHRRPRRWPAGSIRRWRFRSRTCGRWRCATPGTTGPTLMARVPAAKDRPRQAVPGDAAGAKLGRADWSGLPVRAADGGPSATTSMRRATIAPVRRDGLSRWRRRWRQIVQPGGAGSAAHAAALPSHPVRPRLLVEPGRGAAGHPVLVLLPVQRVGEPPRGRLGAHPDGVPAPGPPPQLDAPFVDQGQLRARWPTSSSSTSTGRSRPGWCGWPAPTPREDHPLVYVGGEGASWPGAGRSAAAATRCPRASPAPASGAAPLAPDDDTCPPGALHPRQRFPGDPAARARAPGCPPRPRAVLAAPAVLRRPAHDEHQPARLRQPGPRPPAAATRRPCQLAAGTAQGRTVGRARPSPATPPPRRHARLVDLRPPRRPHAAAPPAVPRRRLAAQGHWRSAVTDRRFTEPAPAPPTPATDRSAGGCPGSW